MTKLQFLMALHEKLKGLPGAEAEERLSFYSEMIEDRMEEGLAEEEAVASVGTVDEIAAQIITESLPAKAANKEKKQRSPGKTLLLVLGSPLWICLLAAAFAVLLSLYAALWAVIVSIWAVFAAFVGCAFGGTVGGGILAFSGNGTTGVALVGAGMVCAGLAIFAFCGCKAATRGAAILTKKSALWVGRCFRKKEDAQ